MSSPGRPLPPQHQETVRALIQSEGELRAAKLLGIPRSTVARAAAGCGMRQGNIVLIEGALARLSSTPPEPKAA